MASRTSITVYRSAALLLLALMLGTSSAGCYYAHLAVGQTRLLLARKDIAGILSDDATPDALRAQLELVGAARDFARELGLEVGAQYTSYVDWPGDRVITTVVATEPGSVEPSAFHFPIVGRVPYKGFFDRERAEHEARKLRARGLDVCLVRVAAYSTLGWLDDPLTAPLLRSAQSPGELAELVFHELVHATVFAESQPDFNEGVASFVGEEASVRFAAFQGDGDDAGKAAISSRHERQRVADARRVASEIMALRQRVAALYAESEPAGEASAASRVDRRAALEAETREALAALPLTTMNARVIADRSRLGDACLALRGTYTGDTPRHASLLDALDGDLARFIAAAREAQSQQEPREALFRPLHADREIGDGF